jgi:N-acetylglucosamine-6-sulfatase
MGKLQETGELDQTLVFYISDNGKHWGEHRMDSKSTAYEESVRVPFALRHPGLVPVPYLEERLVANIDIPPTIYELSQTTVPWPMDGISLIPLLQNQADWRTHLLLEAWPDRGHWTAIHTGQFVYIETEGDRSELYDLKRDPYELENLIDEPEHTALIQELKEYMELEQVPRTGLP